MVSRYEGPWSPEAPLYAVREVEEGKAIFDDETEAGALVRDEEEPLTWTVSPDPESPGWRTDGACPGYGMPKEAAERLAALWSGAAEAKERVPGTGAFRWAARVALAELAGYRFRHNPDDSPGVFLGGVLRFDVFDYNHGVTLTLNLPAIGDRPPYRGAVLLRAEVWRGFWIGVDWNVYPDKEERLRGALRWMIRQAAGEDD